MDQNKDSEKPVQPRETQKPGGSKLVSWSWVRRVCAVLILLFALVFAATWWLTRVEPYATLNVDEQCGPAFFSPDGTMLVTSGRQDFGGTEGPLRVWDVAGGQERFTVAANWKAIETVLFSPDSSLLAAHEQEGAGR
jgi:WD40 repeat protein